MSVIVVVDTNIFFPDPLLKKKAFSVLRGAVGAAGAKVFVPQVVVRELVEQFERRCDDAAAGVRRHCSDLDALGIGDLVDHEAVRSALADAQDEYEGRLLRRLSTMSASLLPYPGVSHEELSRRASRKTRPFADGGRGYNDTLIWFSVLELVGSVEGAVVLLTKNYKDFCGGKGNSALHADLAKDLSEVGVAASRVQVWQGLQMLYEKVVEPAEKELAELRERFNTEGCEMQVDVAVAVYNALSTDARRLDFHAARGVPADLEAAEVHDMEIVEVEAEWAERVQGEVVVHGCARVHGEAELTSTVYHPEFGPFGLEADNYAFECEVGFSFWMPRPDPETGLGVGGRIEVGHLERLELDGPIW